MKKQTNRRKNRYLEKLKNRQIEESGYHEKLKNRHLEKLTNKQTEEKTATSKTDETTQKKAEKKKQQNLLYLSLYLSRWGCGE